MAELHVADARAGDAARATGGLWLLVLLIYLPMMAMRHRGYSLAGLLLDISTIGVSALLAAPLFVLFRWTLAWPLPARVPALAGAIVAAAAGQAGYDLLLVRWLTAAVPWAGWPDLAADLARGYSGMLNDATVFAVNVGLFQLGVGRRSAQRQERRLAEMASAGQRAELEALRFRLTPHFLFNTLNGISAMIVTRRLAEADEMVGRLASFLRAALDGGTATTVTVAQEFAVIEHYARIEQLRFGDRLVVDLALANVAADLVLPPLLLQQLVEQAVAAAAQGEGAVRIAVTAAGAPGRLIVRVDHPGLTMADRQLAIARARVADQAGARVSGGPGRTDLVLPTSPQGGRG